MPKVIFVNRYFYPDHSASSQLLADLAFDLSSRKTDVCVVTGRQLYDDADAQLPPTATIHGVRIFRVAATRFGRSRLPGRMLDYLSFYVSAAAALARLVKQGDTVVAETDPPLVSIIAAAVCRRKGANLINWMHDVFPEIAEVLDVFPAGGRAIATVLRRLRNWSMREASANVVLGPGMADYFRKENGRAVVREIPNWALSEAQAETQERQELRRLWGIEDKFVVGYSGNLGRAHETETFLEAATRLSGNQDIVFLFIGGGSRRTEFEREAGSRRLSNVLFKGYQPRELLHVALAVSDVHLLSLLPCLEGLIVPSKFSGIAAAGCPAIYVGSAAGDVAKYIIESDCGFVVAPGDADSLTQAVLDLRADTERRRQMGANALTLFHAHFAKNVALTKWRDILLPAEADSGASASIAHSARQRKESGELS